MLEFFEELPEVLVPSDTHAPPPKLVLIVDEFDGIPRTELSNFLYTLRQIYHEPADIRCPYSVGIVGVRSITQLNYDRSISPFNIQDEFTLPNFTLAQVQELLSQYTEEVGQPFALEVIEILHKQTAGQPFLVNRLAQILTEEFEIPKSETIQMSDFSKAHAQLLTESNTNIEHLITNIRRDPRFEKMLMRLAFYDSRINFTLRNEVISELATYGVITKGQDGMCQILNPIYLQCIIQALTPLINGLEDAYFAEDGPDGLHGISHPGRTNSNEHAAGKFQELHRAVPDSESYKFPTRPKNSLGSTYSLPIWTNSSKSLEPRCT